MQDCKRNEINRFIQNFQDKKERTIVTIDYANVEKWKKNFICRRF